MKILILETTFPSVEKAEEVTQMLVTEGVVACGQVHSQVTSFYLWEGNQEREVEYPTTYKTSVANKKRIESRLEELHPYDLPQIIWTEAEASDAYASWVQGGK